MILQKDEVQERVTWELIHLDVVMQDENVNINDRFLFIIHEQVLLKISFEQSKNYCNPPINGKIEL